MSKRPQADGAQHETPRRRLVEDRLGLRARVQAHERALLVSLQRREMRSGEEEETLRELQTLCRTAGVEVVRTVVQRRNRASAATFVHKGKAAEIQTLVAASGVDVVIFNDELTPVQGRNLEELLQVKIMDRAQLIMDIFAQRAMTADAKLQVELAQLEYLLPRLRGWGEALSRLGGGIGTRGPGETKLAMERQQIRTRIHRLQRALARVQVKRSVNRQRRQKREVPFLVLIGYTNTGKSTLLNQLTGADVAAEDKLFATLNPLVRRLALPDQSEAVLADTVGFIRKLPRQLVPAFQSTLESVREADLLLHVVDASDPQHLHKWEAVREIVDDVLEGAPWPPVLHAFNKTDLVASPEARETAAYSAGQLTHTVPISALHGTGLGDLLERAVELLGRRRELITFSVPYGCGQWLDRFHRQGEVADERYGDDHVDVDVWLTPLDFDRLHPQARADGLSWHRRAPNGG